MRNRLTRALPKGMEISHFSVLNNLAWHDGEKTPAQLAETFNVTRGAMTNTLNKLVWAGYVHIRPDWDDARRKMVAISPATRGSAASTAQVAVPHSEPSKVPVPAAVSSAGEKVTTFSSSCCCCCCCC